MIVFIDDATGRLVALRFVGSESAFAYFETLKGYLTAFGRPVAFYSDKHSIFRVSKAEAKGGQGVTQFGRAVSELGIEILCANSSQAKGRVERVNRTLQDRLVKDPMGVWIATGALGRVRLLNHPLWRRRMQVAASRTTSTAIQTDLRAIFASLELSRSTWLITSLSPGAGEKMSKHSIRAGDVAGLLARLAQLKEKARGRTGRDFPSSPSKRPDWTASGSTAFCRAKESKATLSMPRRF